MSDWPSPTGTRHRPGRRLAAGALAIAAATLIPARADPADAPSAVVMIGRLLAAALHGWRATNGARTDRVSISIPRNLVFWLLGVAVIALAFRLHRSKQVRHGVAYR